MTDQSVELVERRQIARRLIAEARALLADPADELAAIFLDHAATELDDIDQAALVDAIDHGSKAPGPDRG